MRPAVLRIYASSPEKSIDRYFSPRHSFTLRMSVARETLKGFRAFRTRRKNVKTRTEHSRPSRVGFGVSGPAIRRGPRIISRMARKQDPKRADKDREQRTEKHGSPKINKELMPPFTPADGKCSTRKKLQNPVLSGPHRYQCK